MKNYTRIPNSLIRCGSLSSSEYRILSILMSMTPCYPSHTDLMKWSDLSKETVNGTLQKLKKRGLISWQKGHGFGKNNHYRMNYKAWSKLDSDHPKNQGKATLKNRELKRLIWDYENPIDFSDEQIRDLEAGRLTCDPNEEEEYYRQSE